jgi:protein required for attachment to host cells
MKKHNQLVILVNSHFAKFYHSENNKIGDLLGGFSLLHNQNHKHEYALDPHTFNKEMDYQEATKSLIHHLTDFIKHNSDFTEAILAAEPKMLGHIRKEMPAQIKQLITKEIAKDFIKEEPREFEHIIFDHVHAKAAH